MLSFIVTVVLGEGGRVVNTSLLSPESAPPALNARGAIHDEITDDPKPPKKTAGGISLDGGGGPPPGGKKKRGRRTSH